MERLKAAMEGRSPHSTLYRWLWENRRTFAAMIRGRRPNWNTLARIAAEGDPEGKPPVPPLRDGHGKPPTGLTMRQTWWKVRRDDEAQRAARAGAEGKAAPKGRRSRSQPVVVRPVLVAEAPAPASGEQPRQSALARLRATLDERSGRKG